MTRRLTMDARSRCIIPADFSMAPNSIRAWVAMSPLSLNWAKVNDIQKLHKVYLYIIYIPFKDALLRLSTWVLLQ